MDVTAAGGDQEVIVMYAQPVLDDNRTLRIVPGVAALVVGCAEAARGQVSPQRCYLAEDGRLRDASTHDPRLRYPHSYTRRDIAIALAAVED